MRLVTYEHGGDVGVGLALEDGAVAPTGHADALAAIADGVELRQTGEAFVPDRLLAPLPRPPLVLGIGFNFHTHVVELGLELPTEPVVFGKLSNTVTGPGAPIVLPSPDCKADYEVEMAFVIGRRARRVKAADALDHVWGYTAVNDVSARAIQFKDNQILLGKGPDTFCPLGPVLVSKDELDPSSLSLTTVLNGETMQEGSTSDLIFDVAALVEAITEMVTLEPGTVVMTGTPGGVGCLRDPEVYLQPGDEITVEVEGVGALTNPVVAGY